MKIPVWEKDPDSRLWYTIDWSRWLNGNTIIKSEWILDGSLTVESEVNTATTASIKLSGGAVGRTCKVTNRITTLSSDETEDQTILLKIVEH